MSEKYLDDKDEDSICDKCDQWFDLQCTSIRSKTKYICEDKSCDFLNKLMVCVFVFAVEMLLRGCSNQTEFFFCSYFCCPIIVLQYTACLINA